MANQPIDPNTRPQQPQTTQPQVPYEQQPVQQQYFAQPQAAPVQYIIAAQSLKGVRGWLLFFVIVAGLSSLGYISIIVNGLANVADGGQAVVDSLFGPLLLVASIAAIVAIVLEKKVGKYLYTGFIALTFIYSLIGASIAGGEATGIITSLLFGVLITGFIGLYFRVSKRVKETLVK